MTRLLTACLLLVTLAGCARQPEEGMADGPAQAAARTGDAKAAPQRRTLAYKHTIRIDVPEDKVAVTHEAGLAACQAAAADGCTVLESNISTGRAASASLRLRMAPAGIPRIIAALSQKAEVTDRATQAEDLAGPLQDGQKQLAMLTTYRIELEALRLRAGNDVDKLIKLSHELAKVQAELEAAQGQQAYLVQRVETEILVIRIDSAQRHAFWPPISRAAADFGTSLSQGVATAITGLAYLLPWSLVIGVAVWGVRRLWRRRKPG